MKLAKKLVVIFLVVFSMVVFVAFPANATMIGGNFSGYNRINHKGSYSETSFSVSIIFPNLVNNTRHVGTSTTRWMGSTPFNADSIVHKNIVSVSALGGLSVSGTGGGASVSSNQMVDEMSIING